MPSQVAYFEKGTLNKHFLDVKSSDAVLRSSTHSNAVIIGNATRPTSDDEKDRLYAGMYVYGNTVGIRKNPQSFQKDDIALQVGGNMECASNAVWYGGHGDPTRVKLSRSGLSTQTHSDADTNSVFVNPHGTVHAHGAVLGRDIYVPFEEEAEEDAKSLEVHPDFLEHAESNGHKHLRLFFSACNVDSLMQRGLDRAPKGDTIMLGDTVYDIQDNLFSADEDGRIALILTNHALTSSTDIRAKQKQSNTSVDPALEHAVEHDVPLQLRRFRPVVKPSTDPEAMTYGVRFEDSKTTETKSILDSGNNTVIITSADAYAYARILQMKGSAIVVGDFRGVFYIEELHRSSVGGEFEVTLRPCDGKYGMSSRSGEHAGKSVLHQVDLLTPPSLSLEQIEIEYDSTEGRLYITKDASSDPLHRHLNKKPDTVTLNGNYVYSLTVNKDIELHVTSSYLEKNEDGGSERITLGLTSLAKQLLDDQYPPMYAEPTRTDAVFRLTGFPIKFQDAQHVGNYHVNASLPEFLSGSVRSALRSVERGNGHVVVSGGAENTYMWSICGSARGDMITLRRTDGEASAGELLQEAENDRFVYVTPVKRRVVPSFQHSIVESNLCVGAGGSPCLPQDASLAVFGGMSLEGGVRMYAKDGTKTWHVRPEGNVLRVGDVCDFEQESTKLSGNLSVSDITTARRFLTTSDARYKQDVCSGDAADAVENITNIQIRKFAYRDKDDANNMKYTGVIAQELRAVLPRAVSMHRGYVPLERHVMLHPIEIVKDCLCTCECAHACDSSVLEAYMKDGKETGVTVMLTCGSKEKKEKKKGVLGTHNDRAVVLTFPVTALDMFVYEDFWATEVEVDDVHHVDHGELLFSAISALQSALVRIERLEQRIRT